MRNFRETGARKEDASEKLRTPILGEWGADSYTSRDVALLFMYLHTLITTRHIGTI